MTVVEAVGHGRERGITHEYRGRVFESRFLPKALLIFVVDGRASRTRWSTRSSTPPAAATSRATASSGRRPSSNVTHNRTGATLEEVEM